jgi:hypothetical protein
MRRRCVSGLLLGGLLLATPGRAASPAQGRDWTLILQLPEQGAMTLVRSGATLRGEPATLLSRLGRGPRRTHGVSRLVVGTIVLESEAVRDLTLAGRVLVVTVAVPPRKRVRALATNRVPLSEHPGHLTLLNLQLVAEGALLAKSPFAVVDEPGRTAVLFQ